MRVDGITVRNLGPGQHAALWRSSAPVDETESGITLLNSSAALYQCSITGGYPGSSPFQQNGSAGLSLNASTVTLLGSTVLGGAGSDGLFGAGGGQGGAGATLSGGSVLDRIASSVAGGAGGSGSSTGANGANFLTFGGSVVNTISGTAHLFSSAPGPYSTVAPRIGPLVLAAPTLLVPLGTLPGSGTRSVNLGVPAIAGLKLFLYMQGLFIGGGRIALGSATQVHVLDAGLRRERRPRADAVMSPGSTGHLASLALPRRSQRPGAEAWACAGHLQERIDRPAPA